jgi:hypothetical protein
MPGGLRGRSVDICHRSCAGGSLHVLRQHCGPETQNHISADDRAIQLRVSQIGTQKVGPLKISASQICLTKIGTLEIAADEVGLP